MLSSWKSPLEVALAALCGDAVRYVELKLPCNVAELGCPISHNAFRNKGGSALARLHKPAAAKEALAAPRQRWPRRRRQTRPPPPRRCDLRSA